MSTLSIKPISSFNAEFSIPGDKSISHRAAIFGGLSNGDCLVENFLPSEDCLNTLNAMKSLGASYEILEKIADTGPTKLRISGRSMQLSAPAKPIDCGNAGTGMRLLAGLLAGQSFDSELFGDESLSSRPMGRITKPLAAMGANLKTCGKKEGCAPLKISATKLHAITYEMPVASAQVKSAVILAGLFAEGTTTVIQPAATRDHTERMMESFQLSCQINDQTISVKGGQTPQACDIKIPGDISSAAFWLVAAAAIPDSKLTLKGIGLNPTRTAILTVLSRMGAQIKITAHTTTGEPIGDIQILGTKLQGTTLLAEEIPNLIDEIPIIAVAAALAEGETHIRNAHELRVKETDRITTTVAGLQRMGVKVDEFEDGMIVYGAKELNGTSIQSHGDHRIAMAFAIAGLFAKGETTIHNTDCINTSYPGFEKHLNAAMQHCTEPAAYNLSSHSS